MIWLVLIASAAVAGGAFLVSKSWLTRGIVAVAALLGAGGYWLVGKPGMSDAPYAARIAELENRVATHPEQINAMEAMAFFQKKARDDPRNPVPYLGMGEIYAQAGMVNDAVLQYQAALRRDPDNVVALTKMADVLFLSSGQVDESTLGFYRRVLKLQPDNVRIGILVGVGEWQAGDKAAAQARWDVILAKEPPDSQMRGMYAAMRQAFAPEEPLKTPETRVPSTP